MVKSLLIYQGDYCGPRCNTVGLKTINLNISRPRCVGFGLNVHLSEYQYIQVGE